MLEVIQISSRFCMAVRKNIRRFDSFIKRIGASAVEWDRFACITHSERPREPYKAGRLMC